MVPIEAEVCGARQNHVSSSVRNHVHRAEEFSELCTWYAWATCLAPTQINHGRRRRWQR